jgi:hypothetical protein
MKKTKATELLGKTGSDAARAIGISPQAFSDWPDELPPRLVDRVQAAIARRHLSPAILGIDAPRKSRRKEIHEQHATSSQTA